MVRLLSVIGFVLCLSACAGGIEQLNNLVKTPTVNYKSMALGQVSGENIELRPTFSLLNSNAFPMPIDTVDYQFSLNGKQMFNGMTQPIGTLNPNVAKEVTLGVNLTGNVLNSLQQSLMMTKELSYKVAGNIKVMGIALPFEHAATLYVPKVNVSDVKVASANMSQLQLVVKLAIDNPNDFLLPLENINYTIASNGRDLLSGQLTNQRIKQGANVIKVPLTIGTSKLVSSVFSLMRQPNIPLEIKLNSPLFNASQVRTINLNSLF